MGAMFHDRADGGKMLAALLKRYAQRKDVLVLALPRGGVPVGYEVAHALRAPLDVFVVRKLGVPGHEELALGAIAIGGIRVLNEHVVRSFGISMPTIEKVTRQESQELERRARDYRDGRPLPQIAGRTIILVDDGLATGASMRAAVNALRQQHPARIVVAVPVAALMVYEEFSYLVDEIVCGHTPEEFYGVGLWYEDFSQTSDEVVREILARAEQESSQP